jgi:hypothetical protein
MGDAIDILISGAGSWGVRLVILDGDVRRKSRSRWRNLHVDDPNVQACDLYMCEA